MPCSPARLAANRANAALSTGPRTPEGKARSRANALKHGLCASEIVAEDMDQIMARTAVWCHTLRPQTECQGWLVGKVALYSLRIDRADRMERRLRDRRSMIAETSWEDDRRLEAEVLGGKIGSRPAEVAQQLQGFPAGCDWMIARWSMLARLAEVNHGLWTPDQTALAFHLLGTPLELREGLQPGQSLDHLGEVIESVDDLAALARREADALGDRRDAVTDLDEVDRSLTMADLSDSTNPELKRLRRHESALHNRLRWCLNQFKYESPYIREHPDMKPSWREPEKGSTTEPGSAPTSLPSPVTTPRSISTDARFAAIMSPSPHPPFCLTPDEVPPDGSKPNIGAIAISRELKRLKKAEAGREARRRKIERLRA